ncbi:hypothetical protein SAMN05216252_102450 [Actinacidiphila glaucinigra]|uniref:Uncharacterized protein n=1 Tax=Actinacidiphila glaucinigra TaxID=235986 RepID=A0A239B9I7_9ACTN|nr:hypothetical protein SAMN05216252_102450 [Actinacidiphila glaucinigra]
MVLGRRARTAAESAGRRDTRQKRRSLGEIAGTGRGRRENRPQRTAGADRGGGHVEAPAPKSGAQACTSHCSTASVRECAADSAGFMPRRGHGQPSPVDGPRQRLSGAACPITTTGWSAGTQHPVPRRRAGPAVAVDGHDVVERAGRRLPFQAGAPDGEPTGVVVRKSGARVGLQAPGAGDAEHADRLAPVAAGVCAPLRAAAPVITTTWRASSGIRSRVRAPGHLLRGRLAGAGRGPAPWRAPPRVRRVSPTCRASSTRRGAQRCRSRPSGPR